VALSADWSGADWKGLEMRRHMSGGNFEAMCVGHGPTAYRYSDTAESRESPVQQVSKRTLARIEKLNPCIAGGVTLRRHHIRASAATSSRTPIRDNRNRMGMSTAAARNSLGLGATASSHDAATAPRPVGALGATKWAGHPQGALPLGQPDLAGERRALNRSQARWSVANVLAQRRAFLLLLKQIGGLRQQRRLRRRQESDLPRYRH